MKSPIQIPTALAVPEFISINDELKVWIQGQSTGNDSKLFFRIVDPTSCLSLYNAAINLKLKMKKHLKKDITLVRINTNGKVFGSPAHFHTDYSKPYYYTVVLFTELSWDTQWGGELVVQNPTSGEYHYHAYIPNNAVFFPSNWNHCGFSPNNFTCKMRSSVAFSYIETEYLDQHVL
jgi:hypothetical protein